MAELEAEVSLFNGRKPVWNVIVFLCSDFIKREDKSILNLLNFIPSFRKIIIESYKFKKVIKEKKWGKTLLEKERDISRVIDKTKKPNIESLNKRKGTSSSSSAKKLRDSLN